MDHVQRRTFLASNVQRGVPLAVECCDRLWKFVDQPLTVLFEKGIVAEHRLDSELSQSLMQRKLFSSKRDRFLGPFLCHP